MSFRPARMTSNRPYLIRAMLEWINDNGMTPHLVVDAAHPDLRVPAQAVHEGKVVLNIAARAVVGLQIDSAYIQFHARFSGVSHEVFVPMSAVQAIYAAESGQGMMLPPEDASTPAGQQPPGPDPDDGGQAPQRGSHLRVVK